MQPASPLRRRFVADRRKRPREVDRRRPRGCEDPLRLREILSAQGRERHSIRPSDADRGRAPHHHGPDRVRDLGRRRAAHLDDLLGEAALVEEDDRRAVLLEAHDLVGLELARHVPRAHVRNQVPDMAVRQNSLSSVALVSAALLNFGQV
jgi:hypothetical protein